MSETDWSKEAIDAAVSNVSKSMEGFHESMKLTQGTPSKEIPPIVAKLMPSDPAKPKPRYK